jgi:hypothetical protein
MGKGLTGLLYDASRVLGKAATTINDAKTIASGDPAKIAKRFTKKAINKTGNKVIREINKKVK